MNIFNLFLFQPLYNGLVFLISLMPGHSITLAIIALTIIIRTLLMPIYHKSARTQKSLKDIEPQLKEVKEKYKEDKQEQAKQIMELYKVHGINPFTGFVLLLVQLPVIFALYYVFYKGFELKLDILYSFIEVPAMVNNSIFGLVDIGEKSLLLALLVGVTQFTQMKLALPPLPKPDKKPSGTTPSFKDDLARSMNLQIRYVMPIIITVFASQLPAAISVYWITSNIFSIGHELFVKRKAEGIKAINLTDK